jgi:hypothetical protein
MKMPGVGGGFRRGVFVLMATAGIATMALEAQAQVGYFPNCKALHKVFPHGVGKPGTTDRVRGKTKAVGNFVRNAAVYQSNLHLDRDRDGVACERR